MCIYIYITVIVYFELKKFFNYWPSIGLISPVTHNFKSAYLQ